MRGALTPRELEQGKLRPDVETIRSYGEAQPDVFVDVWFEDVRLVVLLAGSQDGVASHEAALRAAVRFPDQLDVRRSAWSRRHLDEIRQEITSTYEGAWHGLGGSKGRVQVCLWADRVEVAEDLHRRYGEAVELQVGYLPYPDRSATRRFPPVRHEASDHAPLPDGVTLALTDGFTVRSGARERTTLTVRNDTAVEVAASTNGGLCPSVVDPVTARPVGGYEGALAAMLKIFTIAPGGSDEIPVLVGTASLRPELGWAVPPGRWALAFALQVGDVHGVRLLPLDVTV